MARLAAPRGLRLIGAVAVLIALAGAGLAAAGECDQRPTEVDAYLRAHPGWTMVTVADLQADHQTLWNESHRGLCPGLATLDLDGGRGRSFALALIGTEKGLRVEMLVLLRRTGRARRTLVAEVVDPPSRIGDPIVVWRQGPDPHDRSSDHAPRPSHDAFVYEAMESAAAVYFYEKGRRRRVETAD